MPKLEDFLRKVERNKVGDILLERIVDEYGTTIEIAVPEDVFVTMFGDCFDKSDVFEALKTADDVVDEIDLENPSFDGFSVSEIQIAKRIRNLAKRVQNAKELESNLAQIKTQEPIRLISHDSQKVRVVFRSKGYKKYFEKWKNEGLI